MVQNEFELILALLSGNMTSLGYCAHSIAYQNKVKSLDFVVMAH